VASVRPAAFRALALLASWFGFYLLGAAVALGLFAIPYVEAAYGGGLDLGGVLAAMGGAWVAWGFLPNLRRQRAEAPRGLGEHEHPRLRELVRGVAERAGYPPPDEIHLFVEGNAYAYRKRSWRSLRDWPRRARSVVGIGLPLLAWLDRRGVEAVVAHEIGHHVAGDTSLGPWVHRTRLSIGLALDHLEGSSFWLHLPFVAYGEAFLKHSLGVSRAQELSADGLALRIAGKAGVASALTASERRGSLWAAYLATEILPVLEAGFLPPLLEGWRLFEAAIARGEARGKSHGKPAPKEEPEPRDFHTHPTLEQRLTAIGAREDDAVGGDSLALLDDPGAAQEAALRRLLVNEQMALAPLTWSEAAEKVWLPRWRAQIEESPSLRALAPLDLPRVLGDLPSWAAETRRGLALFSPAAEKRRLLILLGAWLTVRLDQRGFRIDALPGEPVRARRGELVVEPLVLVADLATDWDASAAAWNDLCQALQGELEPA
jgi:Zn-dependent protease with chaperone function